MTIGQNKSFFSGAVLSLVATLLLLSVIQVTAQRRSQDVYVDNDGIMRWGHSREEVRGFGINYTAMFAHAYRSAKRLDIPLEKAIDHDIYHFARLGFDLFRIHVWDTEISDSVGNLLQNEHLRLFDYALSRMKDRGMKFVITPIAYWGNGWPEPDEKTPGFSAKYGKNACLTNPEAIRAQERYLYQFLNHVNEYTGVAYKTDPAIIAFEVSNEPHHSGAPAEVTAFINRMVNSMRNTGCRKPVFYNMSHSIHLANAYFDADIQGGTFQWYPTGLGSGHELEGNMLPNVDRYAIPFASHPKFKKIAKLVYEFDAADVGRSYIYPVMARSFREAGMQLATHFAYDPAFMADVNTEYGTHYMNLPYAPQKALSLMIAGEVFRNTPLYQRHGHYPDNKSFGNFTVSYENDLAVMNSENKFLYTNHTSVLPVAPEKLETIAGFASSPIVSYEGAGAYFLDRIKPGVWRLEVMPDAIWTADPFEKTSPKKKVAALIWKNRPITINLADLGNNFAVQGISEKNTLSTTSRNGSCVISPGTYLLVKDGISAGITPDDNWRNIRLGEFYAPGETLEGIHVRHVPVAGTLASAPYKMKAAIASQDSVHSVKLYARLADQRSQILTMDKTGPFDYEVAVPGESIAVGILRYHILVNTGKINYTFPSGLPTSPLDWDFYDQHTYEINVLPASSPVLLFNASMDADQLSRQWLPNTRLVPSWLPGKSELEITVDKISFADPNYPTRRIHDYSMRFFFGDKIKGMKEDLKSKRKIILRGRSLLGKSCPFQVALVTEDGIAFGGVINVEPDKKDYELALSELKRVKLVTLPRPYPTFLPYFFEASSAGSFDIRNIEVLQLSIGPGIPEAHEDQQRGIAIESIRLE